MARIKENSTNSLNRRFLTECDLTYAIQLMSGRWKLLVVVQLGEGARRFSELKNRIPNITERMLALELRELESSGLVTRRAFAEAPPRVEYQLTKLGRELIPICDSLVQWGSRHRGS